MNTLRPWYFRLVLPPTHPRGYLTLDLRLMRDSLAPKTPLQGSVTVDGCRNGWRTESFVGNDAVSLKNRISLRSMSRELRPGHRRAFRRSDYGEIHAHLAEGDERVTHTSSWLSVLDSRHARGVGAAALSCALGAEPRAKHHPASIFSELPLRIYNAKRSPSQRPLSSLRLRFKMLTASLIALSLFAFARSQQVGTQQSETHPTLSWQKCTGKNSCQTVQGSVVLDANWRWLHTTSGYTNCYTGNTWNTSLCPDGKTCASNCALDGADYSGTYGITTSGNALTLKFVTQSQQKNIGSRVYLLESESKYAMFDLPGQEFTFDVDVSKLPCGLNGALYFSAMDSDGGMSKFSTNKAGAKYGTGYCDSQCPRDIKFINGEANVQGWTPSPNDTNAGTGGWGACCPEMDVWEANSISAAYTPHPCTGAGLVRCSGTACGGGDNRYGSSCDPDGCDFNSFRQGDKNFYGPGKTVNTNSKFTVVTQFIKGGSSVSEIRRLYIQNGKVIANSKNNIAGMDAYDSITPAYCDAQKSAFNDERSFQNKGGLGNLFRQPMVLVLSIWDDHTANMLWLDSDYPLDRDPSTPGTSRGTCSRDSGKPPDVENSAANSQVVYSNIKFGPINSTWTGS